MKNPTGNITYCSNDRFTLNTLIPLLKPVADRMNSHVTIYIFSESNINQFVNAFCSLFTGGPSIILVDKRFKHLLGSMLLNVTSEIIILNKPVDELISRIETALASKKMRFPRNFNNDAFTLMGLIYHLNDREKDILAMILDGSSSNEIAQELQVTPKIISSSKLSAMAKLGLNTLVEVQTFMRLYTMLLQRQGSYLFN